MDKRKIRKNKFRRNPEESRRRVLARIWMGLRMCAGVIALLFVSALFMVVYAAVTQSDYFRTESIEINGNQRLSKQAIIEQAGVRTGDNVLAVNLSLVRKRLLTHPWIAGARVVREIPGTLQIAVKEHEVLAVVDLGRKFLINTQGRIFKEFADGDPQDLPLVTGISYSDISLGDDTLSPGVAAVLDVFAVSRRQDGVLPYAVIERLHVDQALGITLTQRETQVTVRLGLDRYEEKYDRLERLLGQLAANEQWRVYRSIDVSDPDRVVVQF